MKRTNLIYIALATLIYANSSYSMTDEYIERTMRMSTAGTNKTPEQIEKIREGLLKRQEYLRPLAESPYFNSKIGLTGHHNHDLAPMYHTVIKVLQRNEDYGVRNFKLINDPERDRINALNALDEIMREDFTILMSYKDTPFFNFHEMHDLVVKRTSSEELLKKMLSK